MKPINTINAIGEKLGLVEGVQFLSENWRKRNGHLRGVLLSKELKLYRQTYCGCEFSIHSHKPRSSENMTYNKT